MPSLTGDVSKAAVFNHLIHDFLRQLNMNGRNLDGAAWRLLGMVLTLALFALPAHATYWNLFNVEGESGITANYITYATRADMLNDTNRLGAFAPNGGGFGRNVVGSGSDGTTYWNLFNVEGESGITANYITYATRDDMLNDTNRLGAFAPNGGGFGKNVVGSGSDGNTYWNLFNIEEESGITANYITYASLGDMLNDTNRLGAFAPNGGGFGRNIVDSGSDGNIYWNLFNVEGESGITANYITYASLGDMLNDTNRLDAFAPNGGGFGRNVVGSGSDIMGVVSGIPEPTTFLLTGLGIAVLVLRSPRRRAAIAAA